MRRRVLLLGAAFASVTVPARAAATTHVVRLENMQFQPASLTVASGDRITWQNRDVVPHTATVAGRFDSGSIAPGQAWTQAAPPPGRYDVVCTFHPGMKALLVVQ